jgi:hypothetical protein
MRRISFLLIVLCATLFASRLYAQSGGASSFCTDCAEKKTRNPEGQVTSVDAICCMVDDQLRCFGGYSMVDLNVGWGCLTSTDTQGNTRCASAHVANACGDPPSGGGGGGGGGGGFGGGGCRSNSGYCDPSCSSCDPLY